MSYRGLVFEDRHVADAREADDSRFNVLRQLRGTSIEAGGEVLALLRAGYPEGALARWRLVREAAVLSLFVAQQPRDVAELYVDHARFRALRLRDDYQEFARFAGAEALSEQEMREMGRWTGNVLAERPEFAGDYGWAHQALLTQPDYRRQADRGRRLRGPTFADLERAVGWRPLKLWYALANQSVHVTLETTGGPLRGMPRPGDIDLAGRLTAEELVVPTGAHVLSWPSPEDPDAEFARLAQVLVAMSERAAARFPVDE